MAKKVLFLIIFSISVFASCKAVNVSPENVQRDLPRANLETELKGTLTIPQTGKLYLWSTYGRQTQKVDSTQIQEGNFTFGKKQRLTGVLGRSKDSRVYIWWG